jgi:hypothetical protein
MRHTKGWLAPDGSVYAGPWSNPSVLMLMGVLPPDLYRRAHTPNLELSDLLALRSLRGTGLFVGEDARPKDRRRKLQGWETLMVLRARGLVEHSHSDRWYLTEDGRKFLREVNQCRIK